MKHFFTLLILLNLSGLIYAQGESCANSLPITVTGDQSFDSTDYNATIYYSYTATMDGIIEVNDSNMGNNVYVYTDCAEYPISNSYDGDLLFECTTGTTYYFKWENNVWKAFSWELLERSVQEGDFCESPIVINSTGDGFKETISMSGQGKYYQFTIEEEMVVRISDSNSYHDVNISNSCSDVTWSNSFGNGDTELILEPGTYILKWDNYSMDTYDWKIEMNVPRDGDVYLSAIEVTAPSNNNFYKDVYSSQIYYSFTPENSGVYQCVLGDENDDAVCTVYEFSLNNDIMVSSDMGNASFYGTEGNNYFIVWKNKGHVDFTWNFKQINEEGNSCATAIDVSNEETVSFGSSNNGDSRYFYFISDTAVSVDLLSESYFYEVEVYLGCTGDLLASDDKAISFVAIPGEVYNIRWINRSDSDFKWTIKRDTVALGAAITNPIQVELDGVAIDTFKADNSNGDQYFYFVADSIMSVTVSSCDLTEEDTYLHVYLDDYYEHYDYTDDNCDYQSALSLNLEQNDTLFIHWDDRNTAEIFDWTLSVSKFEQEAFCKDPVEVSSDTNTVDLSSGNQYFSYTAPKDGTYTISSYNVTTKDTYLQVYTNGCDKFSVLNSDDYLFTLQSLITINLLTGQEIIIAWEDKYISTEHKWTIAFSEFDPNGDEDMDGVINSEDDFPVDFTEITDTDGDGIGNRADDDDDNDGIKDEEDPEPLIATSSIDPILSSSLKMFPNPANNVLSIEYGNEELVELRIVAMDGTLVKDRLNVSSGENIDIESLKNGVYLVQIKHSQGTITKQLLVIK